MRGTRKIILREDFSKDAIDALCTVESVLNTEIGELQEQKERSEPQESRLQKLYRTKSYINSLSHAIQAQHKEPFPLYNKREDDDESRRKENFIAP